MGRRRGHTGRCCAGDAVGGRLNLRDLPRSRGGEPGISRLNRPGRPDRLRGRRVCRRGLSRTRRSPFDGYRELLGRDTPRRHGSFGRLRGTPRGDFRPGIHGRRGRRRFRAVLVEAHRHGHRNGSFGRRVRRDGEAPLHDAEDDGVEREGRCSRDEQAVPE
jgi:hypothetical protein